MNKNERKDESKIEFKMSKSESISLFEYVLKDSKNYAFPVLADIVGRNHIFNSRELNAFDLLNQICDAGVMIFRIDGIGHTSDEISALVKHYKDKLMNFKDRSEQESISKSTSNSNNGLKFTTGNFLRSAE
jgi:collagenase-like PrtC family protease